MTIINHLKRHFTNETRQRGFSLFHTGKVSVAEITSTKVQAQVLDPDPCSVSIYVENDKLHLHCTCADFQHNRARGCRHMWGTLVRAQLVGQLRDLGKKSHFEIVFDGLKDTKTTSKALVVLPETKAADKKSSVSWDQVLQQIKQAERPSSRPGSSRSQQWGEGKQLLYIVDIPSSLTARAVVVDLAYHERKKNGDWGKPKFQSITREQAEQIHDELDAPVLGLLFGTQQSSSYGYGYAYGITRFQLTKSRSLSLMPHIGHTGRLFVRLGTEKDAIQPVVWDDGPVWQFLVKVELLNQGDAYQITGLLRRNEESRPLDQTRALLPTGLVFWDDRAGLVEDNGAAAWLTVLRKTPSLRILAGNKDEFLRELYSLSDRPVLELPEEMRVTEERHVPRPRIVVKPPSSKHSSLTADLSFKYGEQTIAHTSQQPTVFDAKNRSVLVRDPQAEQTAVDFLHQLGFRKQTSYYGTQPSDFELAPKMLSKTVRALLEASWQVEAEGKLYRPAGEIHIDVTSGIDWFDLEGKVEFGEQTASLPRLLQALQRGENTVQLDDGTFGMLPEDWLKKYGVLAGLGTQQDGKLRYKRNQAGLLDALLATSPDVSFDETFSQAAEELRHFEGITAVDPPKEFTGTLRAYQCEGLGWLHFLQRFGFGGCLADDMGLGKTVQVLALLAGRQTEKKKEQTPRPSLIVVPKSLIFNWQQEAANFAPGLRVLDHTGLSRSKSIEQFQNYDIVLTTYGTLRRDVLMLKDAKFDYCILDESQAVKNANTDQAKAVRLLQAEHRLALSGTPVENHLGELWSLFEYLNPGMLGHASLFKLAGGAARNPDPETREMLAKGLRPFVLRRTKKQVAKDLPDKTEQTLYCDLEGDQKKLYEELRDHYRQGLLKTVDKIGMNRAKIQVLEALLRLRQAACHPGLLDAKKKMDPSAKFDILLPSLVETAEAGQKTLVFSQFTSLLRILRHHLDKEGLSYAYLDGKTNNRGELVEKFQTDPDCQLFLISLKAGGMGLNLTAAEYVFLLDPWWNPAVEAQAIDRTHRIGQTKPVFAYRLIARDTVEEKVLDLQKTKRDLADAILNAENSVIANLKREDLEMLLS